MGGRELPCTFAIADMAVFLKAGLFAKGHEATADMKDTLVIDQIDRYCAVVLGFSRNFVAVAYQATDLPMKIGRIGPKLGFSLFTPLAAGQVDVENQLVKAG